MAAACGLAILGVAVCPPLEAQATIQFTEVSVAAGLGGDTYRMVSDHGLGITWIDYDNDGWPDIFAPNGRDFSPHLFHNNGDGTFTRADELLPALPNVELVAATFADYDHDGDKDLYIVTDDMHSASTWPANILLQNQWVENGGGIVPGQPLFQDVAAAAGVDEVDPVTGNGS
ncbi:MAG: FG-GAP repeat domain-containing protein, partial [Planctomycetota bacterium]